MRFLLIILFLVIFGSVSIAKDSVWYCVPEHKVSYNPNWQIHYKKPGEQKILIDYWPIKKFTLQISEKKISVKRKGDDYTFEFQNNRRLPKFSPTPESALVHGYKLTKLGLQSLTFNSFLKSFSWITEMGGIASVSAGFCESF